MADRWAVGGMSRVRDLTAAYVEAGASLVQICAVDEPESAWPILGDVMP
jgi:hypothetical protein